MAEPLREDHLRACEVHGIVGGGAGGSGPCPACEVGVDIEVRREDAIDAEPLDLQWKVKPETLIELIPLTKAYLEDEGQGPMWLTLAEVPKKQLPAGYTQQERWFNVLRYEFGMWAKTIMRDSAARATIETLTEKGYGDGDGE